MDLRTHALIIVGELKEWYKRPSTYCMKKHAFDLMSYQHWSIEEIEQAIINHPNEHPLDVLEELAYDLDQKASKTHSEDVNYILSIFLDVLRDVMDVLYGSIL